MRKLLLLIVAAVALWIAWKQAPRLFERRPAHQAIVENESRDTLLSVRLRVGGRTFATEALPPGRRASFRFQVRTDASFALSWTQPDSGPRSWKGGLVPVGPLMQRHVIRVGDGQQVSYYAERSDQSRRRATIR